MPKNENDEQIKSPVLKYLINNRSV